MKLISITRSRPDKADDNKPQESGSKVHPIEQQSKSWGLKSYFVPKNRKKFFESKFSKENHLLLQVPTPLANQYVDTSFHQAGSPEARLAYAIKEIEAKKAGALDLAFLEKLLSSKDYECSKATLWLGICCRLGGKNPSHLLEPLLADERFYRDALVNICAHHAAQSVSTDERSTFNQTVRTYLLKLDVHIRVHKRDAFARLVQALLFFRVLEYVQSTHILEDLYLDHRQYTPAISTLASMYNLDCLGTAAEDYAMEALSIWWTPLSRHKMAINKKL